jgi:hypothetical protein
VPKPKPSTIKLQVFKGREARLNGAVLHALAVRGPLAVYNIHEAVIADRKLRDLRYPGVLKRVKILEKSGYVRKKGTRKKLAGGETFVFELTQKAQLAIHLDAVSVEELFTNVDEATAAALLAALRKPQISALSKK